MTGTRARIDELLAEARGTRDPAQHTRLTNEARALIALVHADAAEALVSATLELKLEPLDRIAEAEIGVVEFLIDDARLEELAAVLLRRQRELYDDAPTSEEEEARELIKAVLEELGLLPLHDVELGHVSTDAAEREEESVELVDPAELTDEERAELEPLIEDARRPSAILELAVDAPEPGEPETAVAHPKHDPIAEALAESADTPADESPLEALRRSTQEKKA